MSGDIHSSSRFNARTAWVPAAAAVTRIIPEHLRFNARTAWVPAAAAPSTRSGRRSDVSMPERHECPLQPVMSTAANIPYMYQCPNGMGARCSSTMPSREPGVSCFNARTAWVPAAAWAIRCVWTNAGVSMPERHGCPLQPSLRLVIAGSQRFQCPNGISARCSKSMAEESARTDVSMPERHKCPLQPRDCGGVDARPGVSMPERHKCPLQPENQPADKQTVSVSMPERHKCPLQPVHLVDWAKSLGFNARTA